VPDWDPALLSRFDATELVETLARGGVQSYLQYTNSHVGLCLWRTKIGKPHAAMKGRDFFGEVVAECRRRGIHPLAYFSVIHDNWAFEFHETGVSLSQRLGARRALRIGRPNSPYRDYVLACIAEICGGYDSTDVLRHDLLARRVLLQATARSSARDREGPCRS
jgi:hypothetical protein